MLVEDPRISGSYFVSIFVYFEFFPGRPVKAEWGIITGGHVGTAVLIVGGVRARLCNIRDTLDPKSGVLHGVWCNDEVFSVGGVVTTRKAGESCGRVLEAWRRVRHFRPELLDGIEIYQQPAAVVDGVLTKWITEREAERFPRSLWMRDALATTMTEDALAAAAAAWQLVTFIAPDMTPVLQITDTDQAAYFKAACRRAKDELYHLKKKKAAAAGCRETVDSSPAEVLAIVQAGLHQLRDSNARSNQILAAARRNGLLCWRPDSEGRQLVQAYEILLSLILGVQREN